LCVWKLEEHGTDERRAVADRGHRDLDLPVACEAIEGILDPGDRNRLTLRRSGGPDHDVIGIDAEDAVLVPGEGVEAAPREREEQGSRPGDRPVGICWHGS
jgi:hypothetical protein